MSVFPPVLHLHKEAEGSVKSKPILGALWLLLGHIARVCRTHTCLTYQDPLLCPLQLQPYGSSSCFSNGPSSCLQCSLSHFCSLCLERAVIDLHVVVLPVTQSTQMSPPQRGLLHPQPHCVLLLLYCLPSMDHYEDIKRGRNVNYHFSFPSGVQKDLPIVFNLLKPGLMNIYEVYFNFKN